MKERARETRSGKADGESDVLAKIAEMSEPDRTMAERLHAIVKASAPTLSPKTWYGMPAYAKDGAVICFFQSALQELTPAAENKISELVKKAVS